MPPNSPEEPQTKAPRPAPESVVEFDLSEVTSRLRANRLLIAALTTLAAGASIVYTLVQEPVFETRASIILPVLQSNRPGLLGGLAGGGSTLDMLAAIMQSDRADNAVLKDLPLTKRQLNSARDIQTDSKANIVKIRVQNKDAELTRTLAQRTIDTLRALDDELRGKPRLQSLKSIEQSLADRNKSLEDAEDRLREFREGAVVDGDLTNEFKALLRTKEAEAASARSAVADLKRRLASAANLGDRLSLDAEPAKTLRNQLREAQVELTSKRSILGPENPEVVEAQAKVNALSDKVQKEISGYLGAVDRSVVGGSDPEGLASLETKRVMLEAEAEALREVVRRIPEESFQIRMLEARAETLRLVVQQLEGQLETARVELAVDPQAWTVLDAPHTLPDPVNKSLSRAAFLGAFIGLAIGLFLALRKKQPAN